MGLTKILEEMNNLRKIAELQCEYIPEVLQPPTFGD